ncbi:putative inorganic carbon transporter subunit DabA [Staphylococcus pasteuri]|uniref:putative inorganic carbon transporter subunit DabA n=1 Tax=Staphylococcus pasteuri TaxID=45972 RepID=UPI0028FC2CA1|nr:putative inorganic carbon transporter subunit DabA [Staphylococcus pasteuri]
MDMIKWCKVYLDEFQRSWSMGKREEGFYSGWLDLGEDDGNVCKEGREVVGECGSS